MNSDFTAVVRDDNCTHILKCKIIDNKHLIFQMYNKTKKVLTPQFKIKADFGMIKYISPNSWQKKYAKERALTKNVNRNSLIGYYNQFKLQAMVGALHSS